MDKINVVVTTSLDKKLLDRIAAVDARINVTDVSVSMTSELAGDDTAREELDKLLADAVIVYGFAPPKNVITRAPTLKWFQTMSAGVDRLAGSELWNSPVVMTNVSGITAVPISEYVLSLMLMFVKQAPQCFEMKAAKEWKWMNFSVLRSKTVGIVGLGNIGREVARLAKAFGMEVIATKRTIDDVIKVENVDKLIVRADLPYLLKNSDFVVLTLPLTAETEKMIGEKELGEMKSSACLINISRGGIVDEDALIKALEENWIAAAGLDVFSKEPLPADSRLWELKNVIYSPHASGGMEDYMGQATNIFLENLRRYLQGEELLNMIDKKAGY